MIATSRNSLYYHTSVDVCTPTWLQCEDQPAHRTVLSAPLFLEQNIKHFVWPDLGPNCLLNLFVTASFGGLFLPGPTLGPALLIISAADKGAG